ncbi:hypothetical protein ACFLUZ_04905 [Chloroflexota bacterium]
MSKVTLRVFNPRADVDSVPQISASSRLSDLTGKRIGILSNGKVGAEMLLPHLEAVLKRRIRDAEFRTWRAFHAQSPEVKEPRLKEVAEYGDGVIALLGD